MSNKKTPSRKKKSTAKTKRLARVKNVSLKKSLASRRIRKAEARQSHGKLSGAFRLLRDSSSFFRQYWKLWGGVVMVYFLLSLVLVGAGTNINTLKDNLTETMGPNAGQLGIGLVLFTELVGSSGSSSESGSVYQTLLAIVVSLAVIWALRQLLSGQKVGIREAFYRSMYPLVPAFLVLLVIGLQLVPMMIGSFLYSVMFAGGIAVTFVEQALSAIVIFLLAVLSLYLITSSIFAFYIVTLPDMRPMRALRSARQLVRYRRWTIMRKLLFLPAALLVVGAVITVPIILIWAPLAPWVFMLLAMAGLVFVHIYVYSLYRELL